MNKYNMRELDTLRAMVDILKEGSVGNQAVDIMGVEELSND